jgi:hypothetical protein
VQIVCVGFIIAEGSLVAVWIAFGHRPLPAAASSSACGRS